MRRFLFLPLVFLLFIMSACVREPGGKGDVGVSEDSPAVESSELMPEPLLTPGDTVAELPVRAPSAQALIPFNSVWNFPQILNRRPGDGLAAQLNPPRFSWPYLIEILAEAPFEQPIPPNVFTLQLSRDPEFAELEVEVLDTPYNFYNALKPLAAGAWYWRVGYGAAPKQVWSSPWSFSVSEATEQWDRSVINEAVDLLAARRRPRSGPPSGDWSAYNEWLKTQEKTKAPYADLLAEADRVQTEDWWNALPLSDQVAYTDRESRTKWVRMLRQAVIVAYAYRLTGDRKYADSIKNILHMAAWPQGGGLSPEALGGSTKMPSQAPELFAVVYDWFYHDLKRSERELLRETVEWRLQVMYFAPGNIIWNRDGKDMIPYGLAYAAGSHPYQNFSWTVPAILLLAGDSKVADELTPLVLNYLSGVTNPEGPEEGYNEGHGYSDEKGGSMLKAALVVDLLLPELEIGRSPVISGFAEWMIFMFPGVERLPWGDSWLNSARGQGGDNLRYVAYLTGSPSARTFWEERGRGLITDSLRTLYNRVWFDFLAYGMYRNDLGSKEAPLKKDSLFLPEAGWVFVQSQPIQTFADFYESIGMQMQMRPRGGYGHSYASDGSFIWYAYGQLLTSGGGWRSWASLEFSRNPISHNTLLINGRGHRTINPYRPEVPLVARPLAFEKGDDFIYWAADLTPGYFEIPGVERVHRHVVFLDKKYFLIYDDIALADEAEPAHFSWLYHVYQETPVTIDSGQAAFGYQIGQVFAQVQFANAPQSIRIENRKGREGYANPYTGKDDYPADMERAQSREMFKSFETMPLMANNLWVHSVEPSRNFNFLSVLLARKGETAYLPELIFQEEKKVTLRLEDGSTRSVSFDPQLEAGVVIDIERVRRHAEQARPSEE